MIKVATAALTVLPLLGCSSSSASLSPEEQLAVHFGARGEMHRKLDALEGEFEVTSHYWPRANANARVSTGRMSCAWDDRRLAMRCEYQGELLGEAMQVVQATTWDDIRGCYVGMWTKPEGESVLTLGDGHLDPEGALVTVRPEDEATVREVLRIVSEDEHVREIHRTRAGGEEYLQLRLEMHRAHP